MKTGRTIKTIIAAVLCAVTALTSAFVLTACGEKDPPEPYEMFIVEGPDKTEYLVGESFDPTGMYVVLYYDDLSSEVVTDYMIIPDGALSTSNESVTIVHVAAGGKVFEKTVAITVSEPEPLPESIEITEKPDKTIYAVGDTFDPTGMVVSAVYADGTKKELSAEDYRIVPDGPLKPEGEATSMTISIVYMPEGGESALYAFLIVSVMDSAFLPNA